MFHLERVAKLSALLAMCVVSGCATMDQAAPDVAYQWNLGQVAVVATEQEPEFKFEGFVRGKGEGAAIGAGGMLAACLAGFSGGSCTGWACGGAMIIVIGVCGIATLVGGVAGAVAAPSADQVTASEASFSRAVEIRTVQQSMRQAVEAAAQAAGVRLASLPEEVTRDAAAARDYRLLQPLGVDTVLNLEYFHNEDQDLCRKNSLRCAELPLMLFVGKDLSFDWQTFRKAFRFVLGERAAGKKVYFHCLHGSDRTGALATALMLRERACGRGSLGVFHASDELSLAMGFAQRLTKYGA